MKNNVTPSVLKAVCALGALSLSACVAQQPYHYPQTVSVVSATPMPDREKEYLTDRSDAVYEDALLEAQLETQMNRDSETQDWLSEMLPSIKKEAGLVSLADTAKVSAGAASLWGTPAGSVGQGVTLLDESLRQRLNDALSTTPVEGEARWNVGYQQFIFMPNGDIYQPYRSGGNCRDGVFIHYGASKEEKVRGLFCQQGRGSDWYLIR